MTKEETDSRISRKGDYFGVLEPYDGKLSRTVLRGERGRKAPDLPGDEQMTEHKNNELSKTENVKSSGNYGGILWGVVLGVFVVGSYVMNLSPSEFRNTSKFGLAFGVAVFVAIGAIFGEKFMEKLGEWLKWFS